MLAEIVVGAALVAVLVLGLRIVPESQRLGVLRLGQFVGIRGPGVVFLIPIVEEAVRVDLERDIPTWRSMSKDALEREVERLTQSPTLRG
jgi:regulator of protease activity HflC (stomatin/prohibitin superfamily)